MATTFVLALIAAGTALASADNDNTILFCTHNEDERGECRRLRVIPPLNDDCDVPDAPEDCVEFHCVIAEDCSKEVREQRADLMAASALGLWYMQQDFGETPEAFAPVVRESRSIDEQQSQRQDGLDYKVLAIATTGTCEREETPENPLNLANSRGLRTCHGEYGDLAGWVVPVAKMLAKGLLTDDQEDDIDIITNFFDSSCAPSNNPDEGEVCTACDGTDDHGECNLDDRFAGPLGVLSCLREDAADIGFVDHWTAWGAGQVGDESQVNATLRNMGDFKVVCDDGCRDLDDALEEACYLAKIPSDVIVMRASHPKIGFVRAALVEASSTQRFSTTFGTSSNLQGLLFSHGTDKLVAVTDNAADYLGSLDSELTRYGALFEHATDLPQPDIHGGTVLEKQVRSNPVAALGITFLSALVLGGLIGAVAIVFVFRYRNKALRNKALRKRGQQEDGHYPEYLNNEMRSAPASALEVPEIGPAGIDRHGPLHSLDM